MEPNANNCAEDARIIAGGDAQGPVLALKTGLSFWGGVDPATGRIIDAHHPNYGDSVVGRILVMPTSRGSCSGSGVLLQLSLSGLAPAALIFWEKEDILTLGALVSDRVFGHPLTVLQASRELCEKLSDGEVIAIIGTKLKTATFEGELAYASAEDLDLSDGDRALLDGDAGPAAALAAEVLCLMAAADGATGLIDISRGHIDGCILAHDANLVFAEKMAALGARVAVPTTINAISVDRDNWRKQGVSATFGERASRLADAYVTMGAQPTFTCAPYLLDDRPRPSESIGWSESNAVIYANSVLGARTHKHPDYLDLFIAMTGRAPASGVYSDDGRRPRRILNFESPPPESLDGAFWPLVGWLAGQSSPDRVPLMTGLEHLRPGPDDLKALCAAFGTTSGAPMLHIAGHTPEANLSPMRDADRRDVTAADLASAWRALNRGPANIDLVAIGSPHASAEELRRIVELFAGRSCARSTRMMVTVGRETLAKVRREGAVDRLEGAGVRVIPDLCWCSITEPVFPTGATGLMTNSGKYAHYAHGLTGLHARLGDLVACVEAAVTGRAPDTAPAWISD